MPAKEPGFATISPADPSASRCAAAFSAEVQPLAEENPAAARKRSRVTIRPKASEKREASMRAIEATALHLPQAANGVVPYARRIHALTHTCSKPSLARISPVSEITRSLVRP